jgi:hypothetical protein
VPKRGLLFPTPLRRRIVLRLADPALFGGRFGGVRPGVHRVEPHDDRIRGRSSSISGLVPPLRALADGEPDDAADLDGVGDGNGVYRYGSRGFPINSFQGSNYWKDVVFRTGTVSAEGDPTEVPYAPLR